MKKKATDDTDVSNNKGGLQPISLSKLIQHHVKEREAERVCDRAVEAQIVWYKSTRVERTSLLHFIGNEYVGMHRETLGMLMRKAIVRIGNGVNDITFGWRFREDII